MKSSWTASWGWMAVLAGLLCGSIGEAALVISEGNSPVTVTFDETLPGVNEGPFAGLGFSPTPTAGQLNSNAWSLSGIGGGLDFGDTATSGTLARGTSSGGVTSIGIYAFDVGNNLILGVQPGGSDFTPGSITLRLLNSTGQLVTAWDLAYDIFFLNDQQRGNSLNFSYSLDNVAYTTVPELDFVTPADRDTVPIWQSVSRSLQFEESVADGDFLYFRWTGNDVLGSGSRDEYGLDNIRITALMAVEPPTTPSIVPEPSSGITCSLLALFGLGLSSWTRSRRAVRGSAAPGPASQIETACLEVRHVSQWRLRP